jgi:hypothetical protein
MPCLALVLALGGVPDTTVEVPRSALKHYTPAQVRWAKACAARHGIRYRIVER